MSVKFEEMRVCVVLSAQQDSHAVTAPPHPSCWFGTAFPPLSVGPGPFVETRISPVTKKAVHESQRTVLSQEAFGDCRIHLDCYYSIIFSSGVR